MENVAIIISRPEEQWDKVYELLILGGVREFSREETKEFAKKVPFFLMVYCDHVCCDSRTGSTYSDAVISTARSKRDKDIDKILSAEEFLENPEIIKGWKRPIDPQDSSTWPKYSLVWCWDDLDKTGRALCVWFGNRHVFEEDEDTCPLVRYENYELYTGLVEPWMEDAIKICKELECEK